MKEKDRAGLPRKVHELRHRIDALDSELVRLLNERSRCAREIGRIKGEVGLPVYDPERERAILRRITAESRGPLGAEALRRLFERILDESRRLERLSTDEGKPPSKEGS